MRPLQRTGGVSTLSCMKNKLLKICSALCAGAFLVSTSALAADPAATQQNAPAEKHHSLLKGAAAGAVGGHFVGKGHAKSGAAAGALIQHHRNKKAEKAATKGE